MYLVKTILITFYMKKLTSFYIALEAGKPMPIPLLLIQLLVPHIEIVSDLPLGMACLLVVWETTVRA